MKWPGNPGDVNPHIVTNEVKETAFFENSAGDEGVIEYDINTLEMLPNRYAQGPIKVPMEFLDVPQPYISTCTKPTEDNRGCTSHPGCPYRNYPGIGPFNVRIVRKTREEAVPCYLFFVGQRRGGYRAATVNYQQDGWEIDTTKTTVRCQTREVITDSEGRRRKIDKFIDVEVPNLGPMYDHLKEDRDGDHRDGDQAGAEVPHGPRDRRGGPFQDAEARGRGGDQGHGQGLRGPQGALRRGQVEAPEPAPRPQEEVRGDEDHGSAGTGGRDLRPRGGEVPEAGVGPSRHTADILRALGGAEDSRQVRPDKVQVRRRTARRRVKGGEVDG